jgi:hypothetical protein
MENKNNLLCPCCNTKLVYTHSDRYQDISEHVSQPNREPSIKAAFQCPKDDCIAHQSEVVWIEDGDCYTGKRPEGISYSLLNNSLEARFGNSFAVNSWNWHYQLGKEAIKRRSKKIKIGKYRIDIEPKEKGYDYPVEVQYQPRRFGWKFQYWKETEDGCYTSLTPIHRMVRYYLRSFNSAYKSACYNPVENRSSIKDALEYATGYRWGTKDNRSFARISSFIIQAFYPNKVKSLLEIAKAQNIDYGK